MQLYMIKTDVQKLPSERIKCNIKWQSETVSKQNSSLASIVGRDINASGPGFNNVESVSDPVNRKTAGVHQ